LRAESAPHHYEYRGEFVLWVEFPHEAGAPEDDPAHRLRVGFCGFSVYKKAIVRFYNVTIRQTRENVTPGSSASSSLPKASASSHAPGC